MPQFERMKTIYRQAKHIHALAGYSSTRDLLALIEEISDETARIMGKVREWAEFKKSLK